jgi:hypothetical protein
MTINKRRRLTNLRRQLWRVAGAAAADEIGDRFRAGDTMLHLGRPLPTVLSSCHQILRGLPERWWWRRIAQGRETPRWRRPREGTRMQSTSIGEDASSCGWGLGNLRRRMVSGEKIDQGASFFPQNEDKRVVLKPGPSWLCGSHWVGPFDDKTPRSIRREAAVLRWAGRDAREPEPVNG